MALLLSVICFAQAQMTAEVPAVMDIQLESGDITVPSFTSESQITGGIETSIVRFILNANVEWKLSVEIGTIIATPMSSGPAAIEHPLTYTNFSYIISPTEIDVYNEAVVFPSTLVTILTGTLIEDKRFSLKFLITPTFSVEPAAYTIPIIYTITTL